MSRNTIKVEVSREETEHSGTYWHLFADYPDMPEAYRAIERAQQEGYKLARVVQTSTFELR